MGRVLDILNNRVVIGTTPGVGRLFMRCYDCQRIVPAWQLLKAKPGGVAGCVCGCTYVKPKTLAWLPASYWLFLRGFVIRKWILRSEAWDPRVPWRQA